ncbi:two-component regulator propeller domain-containing protein [Chloracidobacterium thermophilum]|uniref:two-component regulator propeller domain-containing protein n=1 Tax=Chloracidobacterium thermophilum TaxID=458033 RepID=UPI00073855D2|nr:two-component regulator propeller domain-containing protein [Chloracidobacterium thermophilum]
MAPILEGIVDARHRGFFRRRPGLWWLLAGIAFVVSGSSANWAQTKAPPPMRTLSLEQGLSQSTVTCFLQDRTGFLWFGTADGLNRYDGYGFKVFRRDGRRPDSLAGNLVYALCEDQTGVLWIGTSEGGLSRYDARTERFTRYTHDPNLPTSIYGGQVRALCEDRQGRLWAGTSEGLCCLDRERRAFTRFPSADEPSPQTLRGRQVFGLTLDQGGRLWIGTSQGLSCYDPETNSFTHYQPDPNREDSLSVGEVRALHVGHDGKLWVGTRGGLCYFLPETGRFHRLAHHSGTHSRSAGALDGSPVRSIYEDSARTLWVGTGSAGLYRFAPTAQTFERISVVPDELMSPGGVRIWCIGEDNAQGLWVGTETGGVSCLSLRPRDFTSHHVYRPTQNRLGRCNVWSFAEDRQGNWWVGTEDALIHHDRVADRQSPIRIPAPLGQVVALVMGNDDTLWVGHENGLACVDTRTRRARNINLGDTAGLEEVTALALIASDQLWVGSPTGISVLNPSTGRVSARFRHDPNVETSLSSNIPWAIQQDRRGHVWVSTNRGLNRFDPATQSFKRFTFDPKNMHSLPSDEIHAIHEDRRGRLWVATNGSGLCHFEPEQGRCTTYTSRDGLANDSVYGILEDDAGRLWLSTNHGLSRFSPDTKTFRNFNAQDGLQSDEFNSNAYLRTSTGEMLFGGIAGYTVFHPDRIFENQVPPPVIITSFRPLNEPVGRPPVDEMVLPYDTNNFTFEFTALNYINSEKNRYAYRLEGYDTAWIQAGAQRFASYTNLDPGDYVFRVRAANDASVWNEHGAALRVRILPPPWKTWWAYTLYTLAGGTLLTLAFRFQRRRLRERAIFNEAQIRAEAAHQLASRNHELSQINAELSKVNQELAQANANLEQANQELLASQQQADRIFSALTEALPGTTLDNKYLLEAKIGVGGFGVVFRARHLALNRPIAVKVFRPAGHNDSVEAIERFKREGKLASRLSHPHIVTIFDSGISPEGIAYLAMELLLGHSLKDELRQRPYLPLAEALGIARDVAEALTQAHREGVLHRDIKPENIFLHQSPTGQVVKVVDFGIAKPMGLGPESHGLDPKLTQTGGIIGTPAYMPPECIEGGQFDGRADVYSLGIVLYEMLTGAPPFFAARGSFWQLIQAHITEPPPPLADLMPDAPPLLATLVMSMLAKNPAQRPSAQEVRDQLASLRLELHSRHIPLRPPTRTRTDAPHETDEWPTWSASDEDPVG